MAWTICLERGWAFVLGSTRADMVGFGRSIIKEATISTEEILKVMETRELELKLAMFGIGASSIEALKRTDRISIE